MCMCMHIHTSVPTWVCALHVCAGKGVVTGWARDEAVYKSFITHSFSVCGCPLKIRCWDRKTRTKTLLFWTLFYNKAGIG